MAVIKIVPMPGAKGDKGDEGAIGPQGLQGATGLQGPAGADAAWYYNGEYNPGAGYSVGDVVTYEGQTWYRKNANGGNVGDTPSEGLFWDLIAAKAENAVTSTSGTWETNFLAKTGIQLDPNSISNDIPISAKYYTIGDLVYFSIHLIIIKPISWGNPGVGFYFDLPFPKADQFDEVPDNPSFSNINDFNSHFVLGRYVGQYDLEPLNNPSSAWEPDEQHIIPMFGSISNNYSTGEGMLVLFATDNESINTNSSKLRVITNNWPVDLMSPLAEGSTDLSSYVRLFISGTYRRA